MVPDTGKIQRGSAMRFGETEVAVGRREKPAGDGVDRSVVSPGTTVAGG